VKNRFQSLPFECDLQRYSAVDDVFAGTANARFNLGADSDIASGEGKYL
jgi:hypothetical protein